MTRCLTVVLGLVTLLAWPALAQPRVALVVGVSQYVAAPPLANPANDAADTAAALTRLGFETELVQDPDRNALEAAVRRFGGRARGADAAVFYYAGHALEVGGRNWLLPRTANITSDRDLRFEAVDADLVLEQVEGAARVTVVLLDSCRDNPFRARMGGGSRSAGGVGLAPPRAALGTLVAYSTAPGTTAEDGRGRNSPFTAALLRHVEMPGLELRQLMGDVRRDVREATQGRQVPWEHSSLEGAFYFKPPAPPAAPAAAPRPTGTNTETLFWESIRNSNDHQDFEAYLGQFPEGTFARLARNRLVQLGHPVPLTPDEVAAALRRVVPTDLATRSASVFLARPAAERAQAVNYEARRTWAPPGTIESAEASRTLTLEQCQIAFNSPCALAIEGNTILPHASTGVPWPRRPMPRVEYAGRFDPEQVPGRSAAGRRDAALLAYAAATGPKAAALQSNARFYSVLDASSEAEAAARALQRCADDAQRPDRDQPCFLYALGDQVVLPRRLRTAPAASPVAARPVVAQATAPVAPPSPVRLTFAQMVAALTPHVGTGAAEHAAAFERSPPQRASVFNPQDRATWNGGGFASAPEAEEVVLERCQVFFHSPCAPFATGEVIRPAPAAGQPWPVRDMPRVRHAGTFTAGQVPGMHPAGRAGAPVQGYAAHPGPKAAAYHPWGRFFSNTDAPTEAAAAQRALSDCNADPQRAQANGPCYLYALGNTVVLPRRLQNVPPDGRTNASPPAPPVAPPAAVQQVGAAVPPRLTAAQLLPVLTPLMGEISAGNTVRFFDTLRGSHRVMAVHPQRREAFNLSAGYRSPEEAAEAALELCQVQYNGACILMARGETIQPAPPAGHAWPTRDMPRARHAGDFSPAQIPGLNTERRAALAVLTYASHSGPKAAAFHPSGARFVPVTAAATENAAAEEALRACNEALDRATAVGPCFLYALGNRVVLPQRLTQPPR